MSKAIEPVWSHGMAFCPACQANLDIEEMDFGTCACCGGEGFGDEGDDWASWMSGDEA